MLVKDYDDNDFVIGLVEDGKKDRKKKWLNGELEIMDVILGCVEFDKWINKEVVYWIKEEDSEEKDNWLRMLSMVGVKYEEWIGFREE